MLLYCIHNRCGEVSKVCTYLVSTLDLLRTHSFETTQHWKKPETSNQLKNALAYTITAYREAHYKRSCSYKEPNIAQPHHIQKLQNITYNTCLNCSESAPRMLQHCV